MAKHIQEKRIAVHELEIGMHVLHLDRDWLETDFLVQGFIIQSEDEINKLISLCEYVYIEDTFKKAIPVVDEKRRNKQGLFARIRANLEQQNDDIIVTKTVKDKANKNKRPSEDTRITYVNTISAEEEMPAAKASYDAAKSITKNFLDAIRLGDMIDIEETKQAVNNVVDSILRNHNALVFLSKLKEKDEYTAEHSLNVCILSIAFAKHLGHDEEQIREIGLGAMLHDIGKAKIPLEVLNKEGRLDDEEFTLMKNHPVYGKELLLSLPKSDGSAIDIAFSHHERMDSKGYPLGLDSNQIPYYAKVVALADTYDAITSNRCYDKGRSSMEALDIIYRCKGTQFDEELAIEFIQCIGIYPPGAVIELTNGEVGIILSTDINNKLRPRVMLVLDKNKNNLDEKVINLSRDERDFAGKPYTIAKEVPNGTYGIDIREFVKKGLVISNVAVLPSFE